MSARSMTQAKNALFKQKMKKAERIIRRYRNTLHVLAD
jgi:hypothetical protein